MLSDFIYNSVLFDSAFVLFITPCLFARAFVRASLTDLSCPLLSIHCLCCIVPLTNKHDDDHDETALQGGSVVAKSGRRYSADNNYAGWLK